jgi:hypothetical protein
MLVKRPFFAGTSVADLPYQTPRHLEPCRLKGPIAAVEQTKIEHLTLKTNDRTYSRNYSRLAKLAVAAFEPEQF